jgi:putative membrane protein
MNRSLIAAVAVLLLTGPAISQSLGEKTGINALVGKASSTADFVKIAAISDMFEIESSKLAEQKADETSKKFAAQMIADHTKTSKELKTMAPNAKAELPTAMDSSHQSKIDKLKGLTGADFDKEYDSMQVDAHEDAVSLFERYADGGDNAELKAWAAKTLPHLKHHLEMAKALRK